MYLRIWSEVYKKLNLCLEQVELMARVFSGQPVGPLALQDGGRGPHYISLHVGPLGLSPKRLFCLFRKPEPF